MKYRELLKEGMEELKKAGITDAQIDAEYLLEYVSGMNRASYLMCMMEQAPEDEDIEMDGEEEEPISLDLDLGFGNADETEFDI